MTMKLPLSTVKFQQKVMELSMESKLEKQISLCLTQWTYSTMIQSKLSSVLLANYHGLKKKWKSDSSILPSSLWWPLTSMDLNSLTVQASSIHWALTQINLATLKHQARIGKRSNIMQMKTTIFWISNISSNKILMQFSSKISRNKFKSLNMSSITILEFAKFTNLFRMNLVSMT